VCVVGGGTAVVDAYYNCTGGTLSIVLAWDYGARTQSANVTVYVYKPNTVFSSIDVYSLLNHPTDPYNAANNNAVELSVLPGPNSNGSIASTGAISRQSPYGLLYIGQIEAASVGAVTAAKIGSIRVTGGNITGNITATGSLPVSGSPSGQDDVGNIDLVEATAGSILANVSAGGSILTGIVASGNVGSTSTTPTITWGTKTANSSTRLELVQAANIYANIYANIATASPISGSRGNISKIRATSGTFSGSLLGLGFTGGSVGDPPGIITVGGLAASVNLVSPLSSTSFIKAGTALTGAITLPTNGLVGQIIPNALNGSSAWTGTVTVDGTALAPNYYSNVSSGLGGGAVGLVPYNVYPSDDTRTGDGSSGSPTWILQSEISGQIAMTGEQPLLIPFYGPLVAGTGLARVEHLEGSTWVDRSSQFFRVVAGASGVNPRMLVVGARQVGFPSRNIPVPIGHYRVVQDGATADANKVRCDKTLVTGTPPAVANFTYYFCVLPDCTQDGVLDNGTTSCDSFTACPSGEGVNCVTDCSSGTPGVPDGAVTIDDLLYYLALFEAGSIDADIDDGTGSGVPDQATDINDLLFFLIRFEAGC